MKRYLLFHILILLMLLVSSCSLYKEQVASDSASLEYPDINCQRVIISKQGDTLAVVNCSDTIKINSHDIIRKCRLTKQVEDEIQKGNDGTNASRFSETYMVNQRTGEPLNGIYKICYKKKYYSIGCYYNGRPFLPVGNGHNNVYYYKNNKLISEKYYGTGMYVSPDQIAELVLDNHSTFYYWDLGMKWIKIKNKKDVEFYKNADNYYYYFPNNRIFDPCSMASVHTKKEMAAAISHAGIIKRVEKYVSFEGKAEYLETEYRDTTIFAGDTLIINNKDTITIYEQDIEYGTRSVNKRYQSLIEKFGSQYANKRVEPYLANKKNGKELHGFYKVIYASGYENSKYYTCRYYNGRPFHPFGLSNVRKDVVTSNFGSEKKETISFYEGDSFLLKTDPRHPWFNDQYDRNRCVMLLDDKFELYHGGRHNDRYEFYYRYCKMGGLLLLKETEYKNSNTAPMIYK